MRILGYIGVELVTWLLGCIVEGRFVICLFDEFEDGDLLAFRLFKISMAVSHLIYDRG